MERLGNSNQALWIPEQKLERVEHALGYAGPGVVALKSVVDPDFHQALLGELTDPTRVTWRDAGGTYTNQRGLEIVQNHDVFSLKSEGDYEPIWAVPLMAQLAIEAEMFVQELGGRYATLAHWQADEMSYHNYYGKEVGLSFHRDNMRFPGLIVVVAIDGECDFQVIDRTPVYDDNGKIIDWIWRSTYTIPTQPGDMVLTRAPGLLADMGPNDRPEHAVMNMRTPTRTSFMLRANSKPFDRNYGFEYFNWP